MDSKVKINNPPAIKKTIATNEKFCKTNKDKELNVLHINAAEMVIIIFFCIYSTLLTQHCLLFKLVKHFPQTIEPLGQEFIFTVIYTKMGGVIKNITGLKISAQFEKKNVNWLKKDSNQLRRN